MSRVAALWAVLVLSPALLSGCAQKGAACEVNDAMPGIPKTVTVTSTAFADCQPIPRKHGDANENVSPALRFGNLPAGTQTIALIMDDPDAMPVAGKVWVHWTFWNLPAARTQLAEGDDVSALGAREGQTDSGPPGYAGPAPPDKAHTYHFRVYALKESLTLAAGSSRSQLDAAMQGKVLAWGELTGTYAPS